jgi:outer membrane assembly lipoprotein YfiO
VKRLIAFTSLLALLGCAAPKPPSEEILAPPPRILAASAALGDTAGATWREARGRTGAERRSDELQASFNAAKALADAGEHADASLAYERVYRFSPRSRLAEDSLFLAAEEAFQATQYYRALELYDKLVILYPTTQHYPDVLTKQFQVGKLYVEEKAKKPSWFLGVEKTDSAYGIEVLEKFVKQRERHALAPQALYLIGEAHVRNDEPELAIESWQRLVKDYPQSEWARLGEYRIALAFISLSYGADYDKRPLVTGKKRLNAYINKYPTGDNRSEAQTKLKSLEEDLAQHELAIAKKYARADRYRAAQIYLASIRRDYPQTDAAKEATQLAAEWENPPDPPAPPEPK